MKLLLFIFLPFLVSLTQIKISDTLLINRRAVIFFKPSQSESMQQFNNDSSLAIKTLDEFRHYSDLAISFLRKKGIKHYMTDKDFILVVFNNDENSFLFDKKKEKDFFGVILTDKYKEPLVKSGIVTDVELFSLMEKYFSDE